MDILLHICCGPCLIHPLQKLKEQGLGISGFFYNPNLYPADEYGRRKAGVEIVSRQSGLQVDYAQFENAEFLAKVEPLTGQERCRACWRLRLNKCAGAAKLRGFKAFTTTLLVSPYQDHESLRQAGLEAAEEYGIDFYYQDFRTGFKAAQAQAKSMGIYRQKYCGCKYSLESSGGKLTGGLKK